MFFTQNQASPEAQSLMGDKKTQEFSPAHIKESIIRAELYDKTIEEVIKEMLKEIDLYKKAFSKKMKVGIGLDD
jgi:hypothetical protein